ncbi:ABC transporter ATP-binding protein [Shimazuella alba]|uniref:ATP-binding cassette domain-containing protein n=1 Tax=Shimazuella alba TaxID=2690964 RepID=A0A6I4VUG9_9BACL|nr:ABC transporter ATP-binding protein [Shimazuella alba]MXQ53530.1 ATP-binding cassette domain-containing protein [Shimazuella alba]
METLLRVEDLRTQFHTDAGLVHVVDGVNLELKKGEILGIVGESGCGKSVTSLSIMQLLPKGIGKVTSGNISLEGKDILAMSKSELRKMRGSQISMIFQEPMTSLNPVFKVGDQIMEAIRFHMKLSKKEAKSYAIEMLTKVGISRPESVVDEYPHQLSGGMRQRVMIAIAMACEPKILIADEPTTALDVTIQAQILNLMRQLQQEKGTSIMLITHDLGVVAEMCDRVVVMYAGQVVEETDVKSLFKNPKHPYTKGLLASLPQLTSESDRLNSIPGQVPALDEMPVGCRFAPRCEFRMSVCETSNPALLDTGELHNCRCHLYQEEGVSS